jgi:hypothetical protein
MTPTETRPLKPAFILMALEKELGCHDWTYEYSDDHGVWRAGSAHEKRIKEMVKDAYAEGCDPADLFYQYYPGAGCNGPYHYGIERSWEEQLEKQLEKATDDSC